MSLSKVHRAQEFANLQEVHFADFGTTAGSASSATTGNGSFSQPQNPTPSSEEAFSRGRQEGRKDVGDQFENVANALAKGLEEISRLRESILNNSSRDMLRLVLTISRQVIHREVTVDPEIVLSTIDMALQAAVESDVFHININPADLALVEERKPLFLASIKGLENIIFRADENVAQGGCLVESDLGQVDATIEGQLEEVRKTLLGTLEES